ncbi:shikimate kinase [Coralliovum pocilloporae]|uniref:shikimate kinase n=1 Tax=Coralliovum pocilloporae TaxID=3066369 RepID=UPI003307A6D2
MTEFESLKSIPVPDDLLDLLGHRPIVLIGMMGAGKTTIGRRLAALLDIPFVDADAEIEKAANQTIPEIFEQYGEDHFRDGEKRVIARLLEGGQQVLATGGGAFMNDETRAAIQAGSLSVWLRADFDILMERVRRRSNRPLLQTADPEGTLRALIDARYPTYSEAHLTVESRNAPHEAIVADLVKALADHLGSQNVADRHSEQ